MVERVSHFRLTLMELSEIRLRSPSTPCLIYSTTFFQLLDTNSDPCGPSPRSVTATVNLKCTITFKQLQILFSVTNNIDALTKSPKHIIVMHFKDSVNASIQTATHNSYQRQYLIRFYSKHH
jgi:hypothetical protein